MNKIVIHMLGYLDADKWVDVLNNYPEYDENEIWQMIKELDTVYGMDMSNEVKELLEEKKHDI